MSRLLQILFVACLAVALCSAEAPRYRSRNGRLQLSKQRSRFLARQEVAEEAAVTPYPSAKELIPDIPFDETAAAAAPEVPAEPEAPFATEEDSVNVDLPVGQDSVEEEVDEAVAVDETVAVDNAEGEHEPDLIYGPPEAEGVPAVNELPAQEEDQDAAAEEQLQSGRLIFGRRINARQFAARPAKLRAPQQFNARSTSVKSAKIVKSQVTNKLRPARLQQLPQRQQFAAQQQQRRNF